MKAMLDKATAPALAEIAKEKEVEPAYVPTPDQLEAIEAEGFEAGKFTSHRTAGKVRGVWLDYWGGGWVEWGFSSRSPSDVLSSLTPCTLENSNAHFAILRALQ